MKELFIDKSFLFISNHKNLDKLESIKIKYGLEVMYHSITKTTTILLLSIILGTLKESLLITLFYSLLRMFAHGFHAKSNLQCWIISISCYTIFSTLCKYCPFNTVGFIGISVISIFSFILWAPSDTKGRPLVNKSTRIKLKIKSLIVLSLLLIIYSFNTPLNNAIIYSIILETLNVNPFIYMVTGTTRNNYLNFK